MGSIKVLDRVSNLVPYKREKSFAGSLTQADISQYKIIVDAVVIKYTLFQTQVASINIPTRGEVATSLELSVTLNAIRKTEQTALMQLKEQGVVPRKGEGGVAFVLQIEGESEATSISSTLPGVPEYKTKYPQYTTYSWEAYRAATYGPPRRLPPINRASIDAKQERARRNREKKTAERKAKWAKSYARVQSTMQERFSSRKDCYRIMF